MKIKQTKRAFILSQDRSLSAAEVVKRGKVKGLIFSAGYVYVTRFNAKAGPGKAVPKNTVNKLVHRVMERATAELLKGLRRLM